MKKPKRAGRITDRERLNFILSECDDVRWLREDGKEVRYFSHRDHIDAAIRAERRPK